MFPAPIRRFMQSSASARRSKLHLRAIARSTATPLRTNSGASLNGCSKKPRPTDAPASDTMTPILSILHWPTIGLRAGVVVGALAAWFWTQSLIARKSPMNSGIGDVVHELTAGWHRYFSTHDRAANAALITSSIFIDLFGLS